MKQERPIRLSECTAIPLKGKRQSSLLPPFLLPDQSLALLVVVSIVKTLSLCFKINWLKKKKDSLHGYKTIYVSAHII